MARLMCRSEVRSTKQKSGRTKAEAQERAKQLAKQNKTSVPSSLSDFPAGQPVSIDEKDAIENMTPLQLAAKFGSMKPDDLEAYLQNL